MSCETELCDIEDGFVTPGSILRSNGNLVHTKIRSRKAKQPDEEKQPLLIESDLGWTKKIYSKAWGCAHNNSDTEYMCGLLMKAGYSFTSNADEADLWLLNSCTVKTPSENQLENAVNKANKKIPVVVAGCVSQAAPNSSFLKGVSIIGVQQIDQIVYVVEETLKGNSVRLLSQRRKETLNLDLPKVRKNPFVEILAINSGCLNNCTYCKTKMARGDLKSFTIEALVERAKQAFEEGCREIWLTSEDLGAYGRDIGHTLTDLLDELVKVIPENCMMRLGMSNPPYILDYLKEIADVLNHPRVYSFIHIPVQSASDAVLSDMKREYTSGQFRQVVDFMRNNVPEIYIATDFIVAFPTESEEDYKESASLLEEYKFDSVFINMYYPRPNTAAARLKKIDTVEARKRTAELTRIFHSYTRYTPNRIGEVHDVLICEQASDGVHFVGHNKSYEHILVPPAPGVELGGWARVQITKTSKFHMKSQVIETETFEAKSFLNNKTVYVVIAFFGANCCVCLFCFTRIHTLIVEVNRS
ncbi:hypothetical protein M3Y94_00507200 [Aphelenchoides besseyi]|nr:hypothetical protein M3Y94_00507200 [Aphelenchoides besseyi]